LTALNSNEKNKFRKLYRDVLRGYSEFQFGDRTVYVKHLSEANLGDVESDEDNLYKQAIDQGVPSEKESLELLDRDLLWTERQEKDLLILRNEIDVLQSSSKKLILKHQIRGAQINIDRKQKLLDEMEFERKDLVGFTAETYVEKQVTSIYLKYSLYDDSGLKNKFFTEESFDDMPDEEMSELAMLNNLVMYGLSQREIKMLAASSFYINAISLSQKNPQVFYGHAIKDMTNYQIDLFFHGLRYFGVLEEGKTPPSDITSNNKLLAEWYDSMIEARNMKIDGRGAKNRKENVGGTVLGADKQELKNIMGQSVDGEEVVDLQAEINKRGGKNLDMRDIVEIHGGGKKGQDIQF